MLRECEEACAWFKETNNIGELIEHRNLDGIVVCHEYQDKPFYIIVDLLKCKKENTNNNYYYEKILVQEIFSKEISILEKAIDECDDITYPNKDKLKLELKNYLSLVRREYKRYIEE